MSTSSISPLVYLQYILFFRHWPVFFFAIIMRFFSPTANISYLIVAIYALRGRAEAIQALTLSWLFTMVNSGIAPEASMGSIGRYLILAAATLSVFFRNSSIIYRVPMKLMTLVTLLLGVYFVAHSILFSPMIDVSLLKSLAWTLTMSTLISAWSGLSGQERNMLAFQIFGGLSLVMIVSLPLIGMDVGYQRNGHGFQGILNHPQAYGPAISLLGAWSGSQMLGQKKPSWLAVLLVIICFIMILLSEARTAGLALLFGISSAAIFSKRLSGHPFRVFLPGLRSRRVHLIFAIGFVVLLFAGPKTFLILSNFIAKDGQATTLAQAYENSRGRLMLIMLENIKHDPFRGIGFGIASEGMEIKRDPFLGLPTSATAEKGILPLAVLEEVGIFGFIAVAMWVRFLLHYSALGGVTPLAVTLTILFLNLGESTLFSPGGLGLITLILLGWAFSSGLTQGGINERSAA